MDIFKQRNITREELFLSLGMVAFPIHVWTIINILVLIPAWLLRLTTGELAGAISYPLLAALVESLLMWLIFLMLAFILPHRWLGMKFTSIAGAIGWVLAGWAVAAQYSIHAIIRWKPIQFLPILFLVLVSLILVWWLVMRSRKLTEFLHLVSTKLVVLVYLYLIFDLAGLVIVVIRNL